MENKNVGKTYCKVLINIFPLLTQNGGSSGSIKSAKSSSQKAIAIQTYIRKLKQKHSRSVIEKINMGKGKTLAEEISTDCHSFMHFSKSKLFDANVCQRIKYWMCVNTLPFYRSSTDCQAMLDGKLFTHKTNER